jgi:hypothetical protein
MTTPLLIAGNTSRVLRIASGGSAAGQIITKRSRESLLYNLRLDALPDPSEVVVAVTSISADVGGLEFGVPVLNTAIAYYDSPAERGCVSNSPPVPISQALQMTMSAGSIPEGSPWLQCICRVLLQTNFSPAVEATFAVQLLDNPIF